MSVRILLVGDFAAREERRDLFEREGWQMLAETLDFRETCGLIKSFKPDIVIINAAGAESEREEAVRLAQAFAYTSIILICDQDNPQRIAEALDAGVRGYVLIGELPGALMSAVRDIARAILTSALRFPGILSRRCGFLARRKIA